jgi:hypothetical protein
MSKNNYYYKYIKYKYKLFYGGSLIQPIPKEIEQAAEYILSILENEKLKLIIGAIPDDNIASQKQQHEKILCIDNLSSSFSSSPNSIRITIDNVQDNISSRQSFAEYPLLTSP